MKRKLFAIMYISILLLALAVPLVHFPAIVKADYYRTVNLGNTANPPNATANLKNFFDNRASGQNYTATASGPITSFNTYVKYVNSGSKFKIVLYTLAGTLVDYSAEYVIPNGFSGWVQLTPTYGANIVNGTTYLIGYWSNNDVNFSYIDYPVGYMHTFYYTYNTFAYSSAGSPTTPSTFTNIGGIEQFCMYVSYFDSNTFMSRFADDFSDWSSYNGSNTNPYVDNHVAIFNFGQNWYTKAVTWGIGTRNFGWYAIDIMFDSVPTNINSAVAFMGIGLNSSYVLDNRVWLVYDPAQGQAVFALWDSFSGGWWNSTTIASPNVMYQVQINVETGSQSPVYVNGAEVVEGYGLFSGFDQFEIGGAASSYTGQYRVYHVTLDDTAMIPRWSMPIEVSLTSPTTPNSRVGRTVNFAYTPTVVNDSIYGADLWTNQTGSWASTLSNTTAIQNASQNILTYTFSADATFIWNIKVSNTTGSEFALSNNTLTIYPMNPNGITVNGTDLIDLSSTIIYLRGINTGGFADTSVGLFAADNEASKANEINWREDVVREHLDDYVKRGFNSVRIMFPYDWWMDNSALTILGTPTDKGLRDSITNFTNLCNEYGLYVIVSPWELTGYPSSGLQYDLPWNNTVMPSRNDFVEFWRNVDSYLGGYNNVLYDLWNEPQGDNAEWFGGVQSTVNALRGNGSEVPVIVQKGWCGDFNWVPLYPITGSNIIYSNHIYKFDTQYAGTFWTESTYSELYNALISPSLGYDNVFGKKALFIGEVGVIKTGNASHQAYWDNIIQILIDKNASFMAWGYDDPESALALQSSGVYPWSLNWAGISYVQKLGGNTSIPWNPINPFLPGININTLLQYLWNRDFVGFIIACYVSSMGEWFFLILATIIGGALYIRMKNLAVLGVAWMLTGGIFIPVLATATPVIVVCFILGFAALLYKLYQHTT